MKSKIDIENILPLVQRPVRYINNEWNSSRKEITEKTITVCLAFPDLYEVGASNLGLEILYHCINRQKESVADRCYLPASDMENELKTGNIPLFALESRMPLKDFDVLGITLQYELCAASVLKFLDLAQIPVFAKDRKDDFPIIIGGGPVTANPEPLADFFDIFVLGDGEEVIKEIIEEVRKAKALKNKKEDLLLSLSRLEGVYVPSFYDVSYNNDGTLKAVTPNRSGVPKKIKKRTEDLQAVFFPSRKIIPFMETVHNRINIEIARGCPRQCRFCSASKYYWPWRMRKHSDVMRIAEESINGTGYGEISFSSLSCTDYKDLNRLLFDFNEKFSDKRINVSLPSLRCDKFSLDIAKVLDNNKKTNLTFAPEAGTDRLRSVIGKYLSGKKIIETITLASTIGWKTIKLYFMIGLPTESEEDIEGIVRLVREAKRQVNRLNFNISISPFVPKAQTPFQWAPMDNETALKEKLKKLKKKLPASIKSSFVEPSILEGVFARGDRRLSKVIYEAWKRGAGFDQWKEHFNFEAWKDAFKEAKLDYSFYVHRERDENEVFPWEHLIFAKSKDCLLEDYRKALSEREIPAEAEKAEIPRILKKERNEEEKSVLKVRLRFARKGILRFLSHLEQIELFRNTLRRTGLPVVFTSGFSPQPKISFGPAISVGYESESEYIEINLSRHVEIKDLENKIKNTLPEGYSLLETKKIPLFFPAFDSLVNIALYDIKCSVSDEKIAEFLSMPEIIIEKRKAGEIKKINVKPLIRELKAEGGKLHLELRFGPKNNVKCEKVVQALCSLDENSAKMLLITRKGFLIEKKDGSVINA